MACIESASVSELQFAVQILDILCQMNAGTLENVFKLKEELNQEIMLKLADMEKNK